VCGGEGSDRLVVVAALVVQEGGCLPDGGGAADVSHELAGIVCLGYQVVRVVVLAGEGGEAGGQGARRGYPFLVADALVGGQRAGGEVGRPEVCACGEGGACPLVERALHAQHAHAGYLHRPGEHYLLIAKRDLPGLHAQLAARPWHDVPVAYTERERGHGCVEQRRTPRSAWRTPPDGRRSPL
jgi:hypothetical protein